MSDEVFDTDEKAACWQCDGPIGGEERYHFIVVNAATGQGRVYCSGDCIRMSFS